MRFLFGLLLTGLTLPAAGEEIDPALARSVVKVIAYGDAHRVALGSGVAVSEN